MAYVDGFVLPVPKKNVAAYRKMASKASKVWMDHGALEYFECVGDDFAVQCGMPFTKLSKLKPDETVVFAWIVYKSKTDRNRINKKVMADPRLASMGPEMPFDVKRMAYGGFKVIVSA